MKGGVGCREGRVKGGEACRKEWGCRKGGNSWWAYLQ